MQPRKAATSAFLGSTLELPLAELVAAAPAGTPLGVEVPHAVPQAGLSDLDLARRDLRANRALLGGARV
ncbi:hypothetical protein [Nonomuraea deserti]|uniref:hypothetical protein n=1 Tax=Nonomuraea deserti TaxID=1848322 RepID=UPI001FE602E3|nr:hypothetical protein [Nonomuraea deserti]